MFLFNTKELECAAIDFSIVILACLPYLYTMVPISSWLFLSVICVICAFQLAQNKIWVNSSILMWCLYLCIIFEGSLYSTDVFFAIGFVIKFSILVLFLSYLPAVNNTEKIVRCLIFFVFIAVISIIVDFFFPDFISEIRNVLAINSLNDKVVDLSSVERKLLFFSASFGIFTDPVVSAFYCGIGVAIGVYYLLLNKNKRYLAFLWMLLSIVAMLFTYKRGPLIAVIFAGLVLFLVMSSDTLERKIKTVLKILLVSGVVVYLFNTNEILSEWYDKINSNVASTNQRALIYAELWDNFTNNPLFGSGTKSSKYILENGLDAHNIYLASLSENGLFGTIVFISALVLSIKETIKTLKNFQNSKQKSHESVVALCLFVQIFICILGLTDNPFSSLNTLAMYFLSVAIPIRLNRMNSLTFVVHTIPQKCIKSL